MSRFDATRDAVEKLRFDVPQSSSERRFLSCGSSNHRSQIAAARWAAAPLCVIDINIGWRRIVSPSFARQDGFVKAQEFQAPADRRTQRLHEPGRAKGELP
jgi:hypothetical protein